MTALAYFWSALGILLAVSLWLEPDFIYGCVIGGIYIYMSAGIIKDIRELNKKRS